MSLDERVQRLSETIIEEVRAPIAEALRHLVTDVMQVASEDRDQAVRSALSDAAATHEASAAALREQAERDRADAAAARDELAGLREQFDAEREAALASLRETLERERETAIAELRSELDRDREAAIAELRSEFDRDREAAIASLHAEFQRDREAALGDLRAELERSREAAAAALRSQLEHERDSAVADVRSQLERERDEAVARRQDELRREHEAAVESAREEAARAAAEAAGAAALTAALAGSEDAKREAEARAAGLEQELVQSRRDAEQALRAAEQVRQHGDQLRREADQARQDADLARQDANQARQEAEQLRLAADQNLQLVHAADRQQELACSDRILAAIRRFDDARSLSEVLRVLADQAEAEIGRAALLLVTGSRLRAWEWRNLPAADLASLDVPVNPDSVFGIAIASGLPASTSDAPIGAADDPLAALLVAPTGRAGLAVPVSVGGRVVAILYADEGGDRTPVVPSNWPEVAEILARHAGRCLELLTISHASALAARAQEERAAGGREPADTSPFADERREEESARRYARLLISEIKLYNEAAVEQGRAERDLTTRLGPEIERARRLYEEKIPAAVRQRVDCFDEEVVRTLAGGDADLLGRT